jgi:hypothetical protein
MSELLRRGVPLQAARGRMRTIGWVECIAESDAAVPYGGQPLSLLGRSGRDGQRLGRIGRYISPARPPRHAGQFQSSSVSGLIAGAAGFLTFTQQSARPERYAHPRRFDTMPSQPSRKRGGRLSRPQWRRPYCGTLGAMLGASSRLSRIMHCRRVRRVLPVGWGNKFRGLIVRDAGGRLKPGVMLGNIRRSHEHRGRHSISRLLVALLKPELACQSE